METTLGWGLLIGGGAVSLLLASHLVLLGPLWSFPTPPTLADATSWVALRAVHVSQWSNDLTGWAVLFSSLFVGTVAALSGTCFADPDSEQNKAATNDISLLPSSLLPSFLYF